MAQTTYFVPMRCLGLIGSVSCLDLEVYWKTIRNQAQKTLGVGQLPELHLFSAETRVLKAGLTAGDWSVLSETVANAGSTLVRSGTDGLVICGSALNPVAADLRRQLAVPVIDLGQAVATKLRRLNYRRIAVLGVRTTAESTMWEEKLKDLKVTAPGRADADWLLACLDATIAGHEPTIDWKMETNRIVAGLKRSGAQALLLADPNLGRWIRPGESLLYPIDAAEIHAWAAALWALESEGLPVRSKFEES